MAMISTAKKEEIVAQLTISQKEERRIENKLKKSNIQSLGKNTHILLLVSILINSRCNKVEIT